jgi:hypothetical protein
MEQVYSYERNYRKPISMHAAMTVHHQDSVLGLVQQPGLVPDFLRRRNPLEKSGGHSRILLWTDSDPIREKAAYFQGLPTLAGAGGGLFVVSLTIAPKRPTGKRKFSSKANFTKKSASGSCPFSRAGLD